MSELETPAPEAGAEVVPAVEVDQTETDQTVEADEPEQTDEEKASKSQQRRERRKAELTQLRQQAADAEAEARAAKERADRIEQAAKALPEPKQTDYPDFERYQAALTAWHVAQAVDGREIQRAQEDARARFAQVEAARHAKQYADAQHWAAQMAEARTRYPDFDDVLSAQAGAIVNPLGPLIVESDIAAELAYHLVKVAPEQGRAIAALPPVQAARAIGALEAQLMNAPQRNIVSTAPPPVNPVRPKATATKDPAKMSPAEYDRWRASGGTF
jgi:hypothetical protein